MYQVDESTNDEIMLSEIPLNIIEESIKSQFDNPEIYRKNDYVQKFLKKYDYSLDNLRDDEEEDIYELHDRFILFIKNIFYDRLNIGFPEIEDYPEDEQHDIIHLTYKFFINGIKKNFVYFIYNILDTDRDLVTQVCEKKKDVISLNFKNEIDNDYDILVLSNLSRIIDFILSQSYTVDEFFKNCEPDSLSVEYDFVKEKFEDFSLTGNFVANYIAMLDESFKIEIEGKIRSKILKKYPKRKRPELKKIEATEVDVFGDDDESSYE